MSTNTNTKPNALVLRTAGTNCDRETVLALEQSGASVTVMHLKRLIAEPARLDAFSLIVLPGGFSYGDDIAAGRVYGLELRHGLASHLERFVARGGYVLGVCNGFQILVESGLFELDLTQPKATSGARAASERNLALYDNASNRFECRWVHLRTEASACTWLAAGERMPVPVAHGEGRFVVRDETVLQRLIGNRQIVLRYVRVDGSPARGAYPDNPNGSVYDIAGICDRTGRVLGLMPHPERNLTPWNHPHWTRLPQRNEGEGLSFYRRLVEAAAGVPV
ncbi:MAG: phosphoribosylformylglycinamidine synthase I [Planctomycetes bacterium]|nr:phosphoribosylformylglycinamidine synthase I [Planctomycetota bacterium]